MKNSIQWNLTNQKCTEIINLTLVDILSEKKNNIISLSELILTLNKRTKIYNLNNNKKFNTFSKYLKHEYNGILSYIERLNYMSIIKNNNDIMIKLYKNLLDLNDLYNHRITKDSEWEFIN